MAAIVRRSSAAAALGLFCGARAALRARVRCLAAFCACVFMSLVWLVVVGCLVG